MTEIPNGYTVSYHAARLVELMVEGKRDFFVQSYHAPEFNIQPNEYYRVKVERVELPPLEMLETLDKALPLPAYEVVKA